MDKVAAQSNEFNKAEKFAKALERHNSTPVVDDDYPEVRHEYESALAALLRAMRTNGRFIPGNRYQLKPV